MAPLITAATIRPKNKDLLMTDGITDSEIDTESESVQEKVFNEVGHFYDESIMTLATLPNPLKIAIIDWTAGNVIISNYSDDEKAIEVGKIYRKDAKDLLKNLAEGIRRLANAAKASKTSNIVSSLTYSSGVMDTRTNDILTDICNGRYD